MVSLPVFRADPAQLTGAVGETVRLTGAEARHAATVRRLAAGERLELVDGQGLRVTGEVVRAGTDQLELTITRTEREPHRVPELILVQALAKGDRDLQAVESCTELGVDAVVPWQAERSIARLRPERQSKQLAKWESTLVSAAKQSRRARWPRLQEPVTSASLARRIAAETDTRWLILHETARERLAELTRTARPPADSSAASFADPGAERNAVPVRPFPEARTVALIVGPEGGVSERELASFAQAGARPVLLGPEVLRSSTAGAAAVTLLSAALGRW